MNTIVKISYKVILPILVVLFSLSSCSKGGEPVPTASTDEVDMSSSVTFDSQTARTSKGVVGGDDNEDDDDNRDNDIIIH